MKEKSILLLKKKEESEINFLEVASFAEKSLN